MTSQSGGSRISGLSSDGSNGIVVAESIQGGNQAATPYPSSLLFYGATLLAGVQANLDDGDQVVIIQQHTPLGVGETPLAALIISRAGALNGQTYLQPTLLVTDDTGDTGHVAEIRGSGTFSVGQAGGIGLFSHAPSTAPRTLAQSVITAITDTNARTAIQMCADALSDMGALTIT